VSKEGGDYEEVNSRTLLERQKRKLTGNSSGVTKGTKNVGIG